MRRALLASLLLHFVVLLAGRVAFLHLQEQSAQQPASLVGRIVCCRTDLPADLPTVQARTKSVRMKESKASPAVTRPSATNMQVSRSQVASGSVAKEPPVALQGAESGHGNASDSASPSLDNLAPDALRQYRLALAREARRYKRYPAMARERGWEGEVLVFVAILPVGALPVVTLGKSSGHEALDAQALEMVSQAVRLAPLPDGLAGRPFRLSVPVRYSLEE